MRTPSGAVAIKAAGGEVVSIGDFRGFGDPVRTTWGKPVSIVADPGVPLRNYFPGDFDPLAIWKTQPAVRRVIGFAARNIASVPWHAYQRTSDTDRTRRADSQIEQLLNKPAKFRSGYNMMETLVIDKLLYDRWCLIFAPADADGPARLVRIPPKLLEIQSNWLGEATKIILLTPPDVPDLDITNAPMAISWGWSGSSAGGISPIVTIAEILAESRRAVEWRKDIWENGPKISGLLKHAGEFKSETKRDRFLEEWKSWKSVRGGTPILENGMEYEQLTSLSPKEARDIEGRQLTDIEVATMYHIPPELLGLREGTFSNVQAYRQQLHGPVLGPIYSDFHQAINADLVGVLDGAKGMYAEQARSKAIEGSPMEQARLLQVLTGRPIYTLNEGRAQLNLPAIEGGDEIIVPLNVASGAQANPQDSGDQNRTGTNPDEGDTTN